MTMQATIAELEKKLSSFLAEVEKGNEVLICREDAPVAKLSPVSSKTRNKSRAGREKGKIQVAGEITGPSIPPEDWEMLRA
jgi:antitoxin (DNA-binding transcriptional repressor) of toxin-antitoxin stability system